MASEGNFSQAKSNFYIIIVIFCFCDWQKFVLKSKISERSEEIIHNSALCTLNSELTAIKSYKFRF